MTIDPSVLDRYRQLYSSLVSDCIEELGYPCRCAAPGLAPYHADQGRVVVGPAHTAQIRKTSERVDIGLLLQMVEAITPGSVVLVAVDEDIQAATWGGLMSASAQAKGAVGAVTDGGIRDLHQVLPLGFAVWCSYRSPVDIRGRGEMVSFLEPVVFRGVPVQPGELVLADANGVVFVPLGAELAVLEACESRLAKEVITEAELSAGASPSEVYAKHGAF